MYHHSKHRPRNWNLWRNLLYLWTAAIALVLNQTTSLGLIATFVTAFLIAAAMLWVAYLAIHARDRRDSGSG